MPGIPDYLLERTVDPVLEPVTLNMCKKQCNIALEETYWDTWFSSVTGDDSSIGTLSVAREYVETKTGLALMPQTYTLSLRNINQINPLRCVNHWGLFNQYVPPYVHGYKIGHWTDLVVHPVNSVTITYIDANGVTQTIDPAHFDLLRTKYRSILVPKHEFILPQTALDVTYPVQITCIAGYSLSTDLPAVQTANVPNSAKYAILALVSHWFANREAVLVGTTSKEIEHGMTELLKNLRPLRYC